MSLPLRAATLRPSQYHLATEACAEQLSVPGLSKTEHNVVSVITTEVGLARCSSRHPLHLSAVIAT